MPQPDPPAQTAAGPLAAARGVLLAALLLLAFTMGAFDVYSPDAPFHLAVGRFICQQGRFPTAADLLWTQEAKPWVASEWLFQAVVYGIHEMAGVAGLVVFRCLILAAIVGVLWRLCRDHVPAVSACGILMALMAARPTFGMRPGLATLLFLALYWLILERGGNRAVLLGLPGLGLVWANTHGYWPVGAGQVLLYAAGTWLGTCWQARRARDGGAAAPPSSSQQLHAQRRRARVIAVAGVLCIAVAIVTPNGIAGFLFPFRIIGNLAGPHRQVLSNIVELRPTWSPVGRTPGDMRLVLASTLLLGLVVVAVLPQLRAADVLLLLFALALAMPARRNLGISSLLVAPILVRALSLSIRRWCRGPCERWPRAVLPLRLGFAALFAGICLFAVGEMVSGRAYARQGIIQRAGFGWARAVFPMGPMRFMNAHDVKGPIFNAFETGGYIAWTGAPDRLPFINANTDLYAPHFYRDYAAIYTAAPSCMAKLSAYGVQCVVATHLRAMALIERLVRAKWALVQADGTGAVFVRPDGPNAAIAERFGRDPLEWTWPDEGARLPDESPHYASALLRVLHMIGLPDRVVRPVMRFQRARFMLEVGNACLARRDLTAAVEMAPDWAEPHVALGRACEQLGLHAKALAAYERAAALSPENVPARLAAGWVYLRLHQPDRAIEHLEAALRACRPGPVRHKVQGLLHAARQEYPAARREFERVLQYRPGDAQATRLMRWVDQLRAKRGKPNTPSRPPAPR